MPLSSVISVLLILICRSERVTPELAVARRGVMDHNNPPPPPSSALPTPSRRPLPPLPQEPGSLTSLLIPNTPPVNPQKSTMSDGTTNSRHKKWTKGPPPGDANTSKFHQLQVQRARKQRRPAVPAE